MKDTEEIRTTMDTLPRVHQTLRLRCCQCGHKAPYDVGTVLCDDDREGESWQRYAFSNYFRCRNCQSAGPWELADPATATLSALRSVLSPSHQGFARSRAVLFDGTFCHCPAMGEEYLQGLLKKDPTSAFLHTRLGNLYRGCDMIPEATARYQEALRHDANYIEARYHLYHFAVESQDIPNAITHLTRLIRSLLDGHATNVPELTEGIASMVVHSIRHSPAGFREAFDAEPRAHRDAETFIWRLLRAQGDEKAIQGEAVDCLLSGEIPFSIIPATTPAASAEGASGPDLDLVPSLRTLVEAEGLNPARLSVALEQHSSGKIRVMNRHEVPVTDGDKVVVWSVPSLRELFRGAVVPPSLERYPGEYVPFFAYVENHLLTLCDAMGDRTDQELEEIYANLRRRPDGRSLGPAHDFLWQVAALLLGIRALSGAQFEAIFGRLARSAQTWSQRPVSRNCAAYLRDSLGG